MAERRIIRNSTAEFLIFQAEGKEQGIEVFYKDKTGMVYPESNGCAVRLRQKRHHEAFRQYLCIG